MDKKLGETSNLCVEIMSSRRQAKGRTGHVVETRVTIRPLALPQSPSLFCFFASSSLSIGTPGTVSITEEICKSPLKNVSALKIYTFSRHLSGNFFFFKKKTRTISAT